MRTVSYRVHITKNLAIVVVRLFATPSPFDCGFARTIVFIAVLTKRNSGITVPEDLNTQIWDNCTNLWLDYDVCVAPVSATTVSEDGTCGPSYGNAICEGSSFGDCCSTSGYCGTGLEYCSPGNCVSGACEPNNGATANGTCGPDWGYTTCSNPNFGS
ncbi:hypothetical protein BDW59DRAFT_165005 [Aspergillus cavernicola]|uniref:Chitin-binding type-1 domain-containing protein n=1 Tax=Aspergillus cavernicola TaxID=176166 RepID=A0ABR4HXU9_9EURO